MIHIGHFSMDSHHIPLSYTDSTICALFTPRVLKLLSEDPGNYPDAPREGIRRILEEVTGRPHPRELPLDTCLIASIRMGTTVRFEPEIQS